MYKFMCHNYEGEGEGGGVLYISTATQIRVTTSVKLRHVTLVIPVTCDTVIT
jgi:hypothetical protein